MDPGFAISSELAYEVMKPQRPAEISLEDGQEYVGVYNSKTSFSQVKFEDGEWEIVLDNYKHLPVYPCGKDTFFNKVIDESYRFSRDEQCNLELMGMKKTQ
jgi:hypothetical protein